MNNSSVVVEGKTKIIESTNQQDVVRIISKDFLTGGDAAKKENIKDIGMHKTKQTTNVFKMLTYEGIPTSFIKMESSNTLLCHRCEMLPLEFVVRRYAWGSYLKRNKKINSNDKPHVFKRPIYEIFHKHAVIMPPHVDQPRQMEETIAREKYLKNGIWEEFCTHLKGKGSWFLPFNRGWNDGAGNPPNPNGLKTDYLWKEVLTRDSLTNILENYAQVVEEKNEKTGKKKKTQIWPRYHQLDVVRKLLADACDHGAGKRYLIQHSAGSGKSNSIAWLAHQLIRVERGGAHTFESIIIVTDRRILDKQIRDTIEEEEDYD